MNDSTAPVLLSKANYRRLLDLAEQPNQSVRFQLIVARRICRQVIAERTILDREHVDAIKHLARGLPFTQAKHQRLVELRQELQSSCRKSLRAFGEFVARLNVTDRMEFRHVADVLAINQVHREEAQGYFEEGGLLGILFTDRFEDSAVYRPLADKCGFWERMGPLSEAVMSYMIKWMAENREKLPDPFAPGGPLYGVPTYTMQADGCMVRNAPALTVHNPDGSSRVVDRAGGAE